MEKLISSFCFFLAFASLGTFLLFWIIHEQFSTWGLSGIGRHLFNSSRDRERGLGSSFKSRSVHEQFSTWGLVVYLAIFIASHKKLFSPVLKLFINVDRINRLVHFTMAGLIVYNIVCLTTASIDYKFKFAIFSRASNFVYFKF